MSNLGIFSSNHRVAAGTLARARSCTGTPEGAAGAAAAAAGVAAAGAEAVEAPRSWATAAMAEDEAPERLHTASQTSAGNIESFLRMHHYLLSVSCLRIRRVRWVARFNCLKAVQPQLH